MLIVYKTDSNGLESKSIEFIINREIDENEFILFIVKMKDAGFFSLNNRDIKFIDTTPIKPITIFNRNFGSLVKVEIIPNGNFPNTSTYTGGVIYER
jgi:hypothetical protein